MLKLSILILFAAVCTATVEDSDEAVWIKPLSKTMIYFVNEKANTTWTAGPTKFDVWQMSAIKRLMGVPGHIIGKYTKELNKVHHEIKNVADIPEQFDSREQWPDCPTLKEVRDQGNCGSCWAISAVETMSDRICIASGGQKNAHLSTEDMVSCCHMCGFGCNGGQPHMAFEYWHRYGVCTGGNYGTHEGCKPYSIQECEHHVNGSRIPCQGDSHTPKCKSNCINSDYTVPYSKDKTFGKTVFTIDAKVEQIQTEIMKNGPVQTSFTVYEDFMNYKSGIYQHVTGSELGGHAVKLIGWGVENDVPYWLVANSWNTDWAENGFFRILRGKDECGFESGVVGGLPRL